MILKIPYRIRRLVATAWWRIKRSLAASAVHPIAAVILTILTTVIGIAGSLSTDSMRCSWPLYHLWPGATCGATPVLISTDVGLIVFWWSLGIFLIVFLTRELATSASADERERQLLHTIRTMPPPDVLEAFRGAYPAL